MELLLALAILASTPTTPNPVVVGPTGIEFERVIDTTAQPPGTTQPIFFDAQPPFPCGSSIVFRAAENNAMNSWVYGVSNAGIEVIADEETPIPASSDSLLGLEDIRCLDQNGVAFLGVLPSKSSIYRRSPGGDVELIQEGNRTIAGRDFEFLVQFGSNSYGAAVLGRLEPIFSAGEGIFLKPFFSEAVFVAAEEVVPAERTDPIRGFTRPRVFGEDVVFLASKAFTNGLYRWSEEEGVTVLVDDEVRVPGLQENFIATLGFTALPNAVVFDGIFSGGIGLFSISRDGIIEPLVMPGQLTEDGQTIASALTPTGNTDLIAFRGQTVEMGLREYVFARTPDGKIHRLLGTTDVIEGETVVIADAEARGNEIAVRILTSSLLGVIYRVSFDLPVTEIPTASRVGLISLALLLSLAAALKIRRLKSSA